MNALAYQEDTLTVTTGENWTAYLRRITCGLTRKEIAAAANINVSGVSRWLTGVSQPSTEKVIGFARSLNQNPLEALIAAGYLSPEDVTGPSQSNNRFLNYPTTRSSKSCAGGCGIVYPVVSGLSAPGVCAAPVRSFSRGGLPSDTCCWIRAASPLSDTIDPPLWSEVVGCAWFWLCVPRHKCHCATSTTLIARW